MRTQPRRTVRAVSFEGGSPCFRRYTFGTLGSTSAVTEVIHGITRRRASATHDAY